MFIGAPFHFMYMQRWPNHRRASCFVGVVIMTLGLLASSFSQSVWHLILTQGVLYGIGGMCIYYPMLLFMDEWFVQKKSIAFGIMWVSTKIDMFRSRRELTPRTGRHRNWRRLHSLLDLLGPRSLWFPNDASRSGSSFLPPPRPHDVLCQGSTSSDNVVYRS